MPSEPGDVKQATLLGSCEPQRDPQLTAVNLRHERCDSSHVSDVHVTIGARAFKGVARPG